MFKELWLWEGQWRGVAFPMLKILEVTEDILIRTKVSHVSRNALTSKDMNPVLPWIPGSLRWNPY